MQDLHVWIIFLAEVDRFKTQHVACRNGMEHQGYIIQKRQKRRISGVWIWPGVYSLLLPPSSFLHLSDLSLV